MVDRPDPNFCAINVATRKFRDGPDISASPANFCAVTGTAQKFRNCRAARVPYRGGLDIHTPAATHEAGMLTPANE